MPYNHIPHRRGHWEVNKRSYGFHKGLFVRFYNRAADYKINSVKFYYPDFTIITFFTLVLLS